ncbi:MAG: hypothetical protein JXR42_01240 [Gammaproteobacteria bacterium]|nr:hypothetical protein [Gammaproteobacteria bacterium]
MWSKFIAIIVTIVALALALMVSFWHANALPQIIFVSRFFDVMLPILAVGALLKYIFSGTSCCCCNDDSCKCEK